MSSINIDHNSRSRSVYYKGPMDANPNNIELENITVNPIEDSAAAAAATSSSSSSSSSSTIPSPSSSRQIPGK